MDHSDQSDDESSHLISEAELQSKPSWPGIFTSPQQLQPHSTTPEVKSSASLDNAQLLSREESFSISQSLAFLQRQGNSMGSIDLCSLLTGPNHPLVSERSIAAAMNWDGMPTHPVPPLFVERSTLASQEANPSRKRERGKMTLTHIKIDTIPQLRQILERLLIDLSPDQD